MAGRVELLESVLDNMQDGVALFAAGGEVALWNQAAEAATGYAATEVMGRALPRGLERLAPDRTLHKEGQEGDRGTLVMAHHKLGHEIQVMVRTRALRDGFGERIGAAVLFHPVEGHDALPRGTRGDSANVAESQADLDEYLRREFEDSIAAGMPIGVLWIKVDQAEDLHKSHGAGACEAMIEKLKHALMTGVRPAELLGRWGDDEFLVISHERTLDTLAAHARLLMGLARTAEFKWWGDRISLTVSVGAAQARQQGEDCVAQLMERAQRAMETSVRAGGNCVTSAFGRHECLRS